MDDCIGCFPLIICFWVGFEMLVELSSPPTEMRGRTHQNRRLALWHENDVFKKSFSLLTEFDG